MLLRWLPRGGTILCFHGIRAGEQPDGGGIHITEQSLRDAIAMAAALGTIVPLRALVARTREGKPTAGLIALTFDDACQSVARVAAPVIRTAGAHATIFAVRSASESGAPYWWDRLSLVSPLLTPGEWAGLIAALGLRPGSTSADPHRAVRDAVIARHQGSLPAAADALLSDVEARHSLSARYDRAMSPIELATLASDAHFEFGVHTTTHRALPLLSDEQIDSEISDCHRWLLEVLGTPLPILAIPYGLKDQRTAPLARRAGMEAVLRIAPRNVMARGNEDGLPRFSMSEQRRGWKLAAAMLGGYEWAHAAGLKPGSGDPPLPAVPSFGA
jgi:peptidoglycan/xylan/chitin deacetylase (PgdA/CDA1 family)